MHIDYGRIALLSYFSLFFVQVSVVVHGTLFSQNIFFTYFPKKIIDFLVPDKLYGVRLFLLEMT